ncbi:MAG: Asp-tRNA(Asn)/Glu-tRNA(Gln) amidotransferase subunit GatA [Patescibacteria group bacterium]|nr:Asp-tRNA(Asn)/Glu-tRNA(Gln) amidotransferase subunit GatA [Patescibacteria group bacterium]
MNLNSLTLKEAKKGLLSKDFSSVELTKACLGQIEKYDKEINSYITVCNEEALKQAELSDSKIKDGDDSPLLGIPIAVKDLYSTKGIRTTAASKVLENYIPQYDATAIAKIKNAGAVILGKANCDAWAHGSSGENSDFGPTKNPWNKNCVPGGSSSGSAASLASDMCIASTGTDTGGSIRLPASFCNIVGLKPTYGRVSRYGIVAMASSLDSIGHFTRTVEDNAMFLNVTAGKDVFDATTPYIAVPDYAKGIKNGIENLKIGVPKEYINSGMDPVLSDLFQNVLTEFESLGANIINVSLPHTEYAIACYYIIQPAEVSSNLARYDGIRYGNDRSYFGKEAKRRIILGTYTLSAGYYDAYYKKAMQVRTLIKKDFEDAFKNIDAIVAPVSPTLPWKLGEKVNDPLKMYLSDIFTVTANLAGIPGLSVPAGLVDGLPVGIQILGPQFSEEMLYRVGYAFEQKTKHYKEKPKL